MFKLSICMLGLQEWDYTVLMVADPLTKLLDLAERVFLSPPKLRPFLSLHLKRNL